VLRAVCSLRAKELATKKDLMFHSDSPMKMTMLNLRLIIAASIEEEILLPPNLEQFLEVNLLSVF
jgi:hypothetical protein